MQDLRDELCRITEQPRCEIRMTTKPFFWMTAALISIAAALFALSYFPRVFPIIAVDISMTRDDALSSAEQLAADKNWGPSKPRAAASFSLDRRLQTFVELEAGGVEAFAKTLDDAIYTPYTWRVRLFEEGNINEVTVLFRPDGRRFGFSEKIPEDAERPNISSDAAKALAVETAFDDWQIDLSNHELVETGKEEKPNGRIDHRFVYERGEKLGEGRYQVQLAVSGDRVSQVRPSVLVPQSFDRRYEEMRSANNGIAMGGSVGVALYVLVGCGFGFFFLLRRRTLLWRPALLLAVVITSAQILAGLNALPLAWLNYNTSLPSTSFLIQALLPIILNSLVLGVVLAFSFIAAEGLSRMAFPHHVQMWRIWSRESAPTYEIAGQTAIGYLAVPLMLTYLVLFYFIAGRFWGWWNPADTLANPDSLAHYLPWLTPFSMALQAGVWEECLFRAVPLAGAALIGERYGKRGLFIGVMLIIQVIIFGAAHANYPAQPAYARLIELIVPSLLFGLMYIRFGLLPAIILHFLFDIVLMSIPIFAAVGAGVDKAMIGLIVLTPALIVVVRGLQRGGLDVFDPALRNRGWQVSTPVTAEKVTEVTVQSEWPRWLIPVLAIVALLLFPTSSWLQFTSKVAIPTLEISSAEALAIAEQELKARNVVLPAQTQSLISVAGNPSPMGAFIWQTTDQSTYENMLGQWLHPPRYRVRFVRFEGDVAERADEWIITVTGDGEVRSVLHQLPEDAEGADLEEDAARTLAYAGLARELQIDAGTVRETSVVPKKQPARTDWRFTYSDTESEPLPLGERRVTVSVAGDQVVSAIPFVHVPEEWKRQQQSKIAMNVVGIMSSLSLVILLVCGLVAGIIAWSKGAINLRFVTMTSLTIAIIGIAGVVNNIPNALAGFSTAQPYGTQIMTTLVSNGMLLVVMIAAIGLNVALISTWRQNRTPVAAGTLITAGVLIALVRAGSDVFSYGLSTFQPAWPATTAAATMMPILAATIENANGFIINTVLFLLVFGFIDRLTNGGYHKRVFAIGMLFLFGALTANSNASGIIETWLIAALVSGITTVAIYWLVIRHDLAVIPIFVATAIVINLLPTGTEPYPGALAGNLLAIIVVGALGVVSFKALREQ